MQKIDDPGGLLEQCGAADPTETIDEMEKKSHHMCYDEGDEPDVWCRIELHDRRNGCTAIQSTIRQPKHVADVFDGLKHDILYHYIISLSPLYHTIPAFVMWQHDCSLQFLGSKHRFLQPPTPIWWLHCSPGPEDPKRLYTLCCQPVLWGFLKCWITKRMIYPLVICYVAIENGHRNSGFAHWKWWFSIVI